MGTAAQVSAEKSVSSGGSSGEDFGINNSLCVPLNHSAHTVLEIFFQWFKGHLAVPGIKRSAGIPQIQIFFRHFPSRPVKQRNLILQPVPVGILSPESIQNIMQLIYRGRNFQPQLVQPVFADPPVFGGKQFLVFGNIINISIQRRRRLEEPGILFHGLLNVGRILIDQVVQRDQAAVPPQFFHLSRIHISDNIGKLPGA